jgi:phosphate:Na+ symporter
MDITHITSLLGGIALFLYGMSIMGAGLEKLAGGTMQSVLQKLTSSTVKGVIFGTLITAVIQSSAGTVVICVGLVNSGIMSLTQSVGVIMGANIGTTVTGQLIRLADISGDSLLLTLVQPKTFAPVVAFIGCIFYVFLKNAKKKNIGQIMLGFGILFTGMSLMDTGVSPLKESEMFQNLFINMKNPILGVLAGVLVTVAIQSSSASVGILQALSSTGLVTFGSAVPIILGTHIGTAFTPLLTIGGSTKDGKRTALVHLYFNIIGSVVVLVLTYLYKFLFGIAAWDNVLNKGSIANIHTLSSVFAMLLFIPFSRVLVKLVRVTVRDSEEETQELSMPVLDERLYKSPSVALQQAKNAVVKMGHRAAHNVNLALPLLLKMNEETVQSIRVRENLIDRTEVAVTNYLIKLTDRELGDEESHVVTELLNFVTEYERIGDYAVNLMEKAEELAEQGGAFSGRAENELSLLMAALEQILALTEDAFGNEDAHKALHVEPLEETIDVLCDRLRSQHVDRLKSGVCSIDTGVVFLDVLNYIERIADHCSNVAARIIGMEQGEEFDSHTLKRMMHHNPGPEYLEDYEHFRKEYLLPLESLEA